MGVRILNNIMSKRLTQFGALIMCVIMILCLTSCSGIDADKKTSDTKKTSASTTVSKKAKNAGEGKKVYFAGPMFNQGEKDFNLKIVKVLEDSGYEVFLPQRDGIEAALLEGKTEEELTEMIFELDDSEVEKADILFMNIDGRVPDEGACVELGIAYAKGKRCYGFKTDTRSIEKSMDLNPMIAGCMIKIFKNYDGDELAKDIKKYLSKNEL